MPKQCTKSIKHVLLDIEGTVCPITFVKETLFPYALSALPTIAQSQWDDPVFTTYRDAFPPEHRKSPTALVAHAEDLTKRDVKVAYLKNLQGFLWQSGYEDGAYATPLYDDVSPKLSEWTESGVPVSIYSSGSVFAQKLLFGHVKNEKRKIEGEAKCGEAKDLKPMEKDKDTIDLTGSITGWFDTTNAGSKLERQSYEKIAGALNLEPRQILFLSDAAGEISAAKEAGMEVAVVMRKENKELTVQEKEKFDTVTTFDEIEIGR